MDLLRIFNLVDDRHDVNVQGTYEEPLFQADHIGDLLGMKKIGDTIKDFSVKYKVSLSTTILGVPQEVTFLTEKGLYKILGLSRNNVAKTFQEWMSNVVKEIRTNGEYKVVPDPVIEPEDDEIDALVSNYVPVPAPQDVPQDAPSPTVPLGAPTTSPASTPATRRSSSTTP